ncbi:TonB-dependent receptor [Olivibacter sp. XZL3]|uniref:SusC/RagA family TonB-linked outer membrane protein n=1 Tax=Olivibacter sp. XZL3 TaxID=1735116 RepID=UPI0010665757|nr:TonB-dependent receptor [Olivibacter sp. XZL3]
MTNRLLNLSYFLSLLTFISFAQLALAQTATQRITGTVTDSVSGEALTNVSIIEIGTTRGVATDADGRFAITVAPNAKLVFSYIGYQRKEIAIGSQHVLNVKMVTDAQELSEIVVVGYGTQSKKEFTGSAAQILADEVKDVPVQSFDQALSGRAAGVNISIPNGQLNNAPVIRVRGINSISLSSYPLIVVDGIPINTGDVSASSNVANNPLADINPADIESIDVLKDAASTAIYGSRAAAGVLLVTTKKGKQGSAKVNYQGWVGISNAARLPTQLDAEQYMAIKNEAVLNSKILGGNENNDNVASALFFPMYNEDGSLVNTNWYDYIYQTGVSHNHSINVSGASETTHYYFSANSTDQNGILRTNEFNRRGVRFNLDHQVTPWLQVKGSLNYTKSFNQSPNTGSRSGQAQAIAGAARMSYILPPNVPPYNPDGTPYINTESPAGTIGNGNNEVTWVYYNPIAFFDLARYSSANDHIIGNVGATLNLAKGLTFTTNYSLDRTNISTISAVSPVQGSGSSTNGSVTNVSGVMDNWNFTNTLNYDTRFGNHHLTLLGGYDAQNFEVNRWGANVQQAADPFFTDYQGNWGAVTQSGNRLATKSFLSYFSRVSYDFGGKYFFTLNFRRDGVSSLGADKKWGNFGGISGGWLLSDESFYKNSSLANVMNSVKLRASWGRVGNGNVDEYAALTLFGSDLYGGAPTWALSQAGNADLGWETSEQTNIGADLSFFNNKMQVELTYFYNNVNGLILSVPQAPSKGIPDNSILGNVGSLTNKGLEFSISSDNIRTSKFSWNTSFNFTYLKNNVTSLVNEGDRILTTSSGDANIFNVTQVGLPVGTLFGAITDGVNPDNGRLIFVNAAGERVQFTHVADTENGDYRWSYLDGTEAPAITASDYQPMGNTLPKWQGGINNTLNYGSFDLSFNFTYGGGYYMFNGNRGTWIDQRMFNNSTRVLDRWTSPGQVTDVPRLVYNDNFGSANIPNISANVEKADFLRLQNLALGYSLPKTFLSKAHINSLRVYLQATNLFLITGYTGLDPEASINGNTTTSSGLDYNSLPNSRTFTLGVNVAF